VAALVAYCTTGWAGMYAVVSVVAMVTIYQLVAERERRRALLDIYLNAPAGTEVIQDGGLAGLSLRVRLGDDERRPAAALVIGRPVIHSACGRPARRSRP
jgi:hypothetical protein